ncbi:MAG TPA: glycosyltransferase [Bacteroidales bacterium]|nr:glycosyltransferase [Bacteroidales bacterium]
MSNILVVGPSLKLGGVERASSNIANAFAAHGHHITFLALFPQSHFFKLQPGVNFVEPLNGLNAKRLNIFKTIGWVRKQASHLKPDVVLVFGYFYSAVTRLALAGLKIPVFASDRASPLFKWPIHVHLFNHMVFTLFPPAGLIAQTGQAAEKQRAYFKKRTRINVIPNALRQVQLHPDLTRQKTVLAVGRLTDHLKGFDRLIEAFAKIGNQDWLLVFAGGDTDGGHLKKQARELGIYDRVRFLGKVKDLDRVLAGAGIFVIPSRSEGYPNALCEAMAAGLPCIAFDFVAGPRDIITHNHDGLIVENGNTNALAATIDYLIENPAERERLGKNAMEISERLNLDKIGGQYLSFILNTDNGKQIESKN